MASGPLQTCLYIVGGGLGSNKIQMLGKNLIHNLSAKIEELEARIKKLEK